MELFAESLIFAHYFNKHNVILSLTGM